MPDPIPFPKKEKKIWVCECGCCTYQLHSDGNVVCADCETAQAGYGGWWTPPNTDVETDKIPVTLVGSVDDGSALELARIKRNIQDGNTALAMVVHQNGQMHVWADVATYDQAQWAKRRLADAVNILKLDQFKKEDP